MDTRKISLPFKNQSAEVSLAAAAAVEAGEAINEIYRRNFSVSQNSDGAPVSEADLASNKIIYGILARSGYLTLSEENEDDGSRLAAKKVWIVDPLDGTADFIAGTGEFAVMIGLVENNLPIAGVIYQPVGDILYVAQKGQGAYFLQEDKWKKFAVSDESDLSRSRVIMSRNHLSDRERLFLKELNMENFIQRGSCLKAIEIAKGKADLYFTFTDKIKQWDTCASNILIHEAGGKMTDMFGNDIFYNTEKINHQNGILVTNSAIHKQIIEKYRTFYSGIN